MEYTVAARNRKDELERYRDGHSNPGSASLLRGRDSGLDCTTADPGRAVLGLWSYHSSFTM